MVFGGSVKRFTTTVYIGTKTTSVFLNSYLLALETFLQHILYFQPMKKTQTETLLEGSYSLSVIVHDMQKFHTFYILSIPSSGYSNVQSPSFFHMIPAAGSSGSKTRLKSMKRQKILFLVGQAQSSYKNRVWWLP